MTENQQAMLRALALNDWRTSDCTAGHSRAINSLIKSGLAEIERVGGIRWVRLTPIGRERGDHHPAAVEAMNEKDAK